jgi:hypothetical protein
MAITQVPKSEQSSQDELAGIINKVSPFFAFFWLKLTYSQHKSKHNARLLSA